jgi:hypothetical protein
MYSTLPERFVRERGDEVYIQSRHPGFRNDEVRDLVWGRNPFVSGFIQEDPSAGACVVVDTLIRDAKRYGNSITAVERGHGFEPHNVKPRVYYQPTFRRDAAHLVLADPTSITQALSPETFQDFTRHVCRWSGYDIGGVTVIESAHRGEHGREALPSNPRIEAANIYEYADLLYSCKAFLTTESGGMSLASALRDRGTHALVCAHTWNDSVWRWPNVEYRVTGKMGSDYLQYDEPTGLGDVK